MLEIPDLKMPSYVGVAWNYDNRKCVVTISLDDFGSNTSAWQNCLNMLTRKRLYHTIGIITRNVDWNFTQYWINQGYTEAASHSATHSDPYLNSAKDCEWQVNASKQDIISHLSLPSWWRNKETQYVYAWIDPYGRSNDVIQQWLGKCNYLVERGVCAYPSADPTKWNSIVNVFDQTGITAEIGPNYGGTTSVSVLSNKFNSSYSEGRVFHLIAHPMTVNWSKGGYADQFTDYISRKRDVWYVPFGLLGLYRSVNIRNATHVTRIEGKPFYTFKITIDKNIHELYGLAYPITYVFKIPPNWTCAQVYYCNTPKGEWKSMITKKWPHSFNGLEAVRFDFSKHEAYVSIAFSPSSDNLYVRILPLTLPKGNFI